MIFVINIMKKKSKKLMKAIALINLILIVSCNIDKPPPEVSKFWVKKDTTYKEKAQVMAECGYPDIDGALGKGLSTNEIAEIHICMIKKGFKIKGNDHYCITYPHLPACEKARKDNIIK